MNFLPGLKRAILYFGFVSLITACGKSPTTPDSPTIPVASSKKWIVSTIAGSSTPGFKDGDSTQVQFNAAQAIVADNNGYLFVGEIAIQALDRSVIPGTLQLIPAKPLLTLVLVIFIVL
ncbi:hypothetical protein [Mucilaginibacter agri]|uniref:Uncharacterized protein n=1 Tax=Mucilaginibacter agri TaxID=2695265 RepID=A0A965ZKD0_9SPHI|nr:hypothetical protein [Mucilaginibacter agri]NCD71652.1 hypothetical protein [Mucilaginibacter agri]